MPCNRSRVYIEGWRSCVQARSAYARVKQAVELFQRETPKPRLPKPQAFPVRGSCFLHWPPGSKEPVLNGVSLELAPGESRRSRCHPDPANRPSACILVGCLVPTAGKVRLDGTELRNWDRRQFGEYTGYLPQEVELFPGTIKQNICRMRDDLPDASIYEAATISGVHDMVCQLSQGYETVLDRSEAGFRRTEAAHRARPRFLRQSVLSRTRRARLKFGRSGRAGSYRDPAAGQEAGRYLSRRYFRPALIDSVDKVPILRGGRQKHSDLRARCCIVWFGHPAEVMRTSLSSRDASRPRSGG